jgi:hypothetical protein
VTESARLAGDNYNTRSILMTEALATMVAGVFGGVSQTTPYIGHPAYKDMEDAPRIRSRPACSSTRRVLATFRSWR